MICHIIIAGLVTYILITNNDNYTWLYMITPDDWMIIDLFKTLSDGYFIYEIVICVSIILISLTYIYIYYNYNIIAIL